MSPERGQLSIPPETLNNQARAADPRWSIWVAANAGSGKTFVLTRRVLRLLLAGVEPQAILCLTYTKAAAAEMRKRVSAALAQWAVTDEVTLNKTLADIEGPDIPRLLRERARTLFAKALETPGGLKIVTIHAFCEAVLHRFPLEAQVPYDFSVIEDNERNAMLLAARETVLAEGIGVAGAVETLLETLSDEQIRSAVETALTDGRKLKAVLGNPEKAKTNLRRLVGMGLRDTTTIAAELAQDTTLTPTILQEIINQFDGDGSKTRGARFVDMLARNNSSRLSARDLRGLFLTDKGPRTTLLNASQQRQRPDLFALLMNEQERVVALAEELAAAELVARSEAVLDIVTAIAHHYETRKRARSLLDFDDLIEKLADLFANRTAGEWVRYKLDGGIDHILVDESQDTNGEQWRVIRAIAGEYFVGQGAVSRPRSLFAVGDQKQSIYSFQGAEPALFDETGRDYERQATLAETSFKRLPLHTSFRTLPEILAAVDLVCSRSDIQTALLEKGPVHHDTARTMRGGRVILWPPVQVQQSNELPAALEWPTTPRDTVSTAPRQVAQRIAREISLWITEKRALTGRGRAITADDVLILVQSRGMLFQEIIRALRAAGLPTPGADRLKVTGHIAVMDMLALCEVLLNPADDLQLAALLRSPLFDVDEKDLHALAQPRAKGETLWSSLSVSSVPAGKTACQTLQRWRSTLDFERPYEFLAQVLYTEGGLKRFHARLGGEVDDVFSELLTLALEHEQSNQPSLQGFVAAMRQRQDSIKRELPETGVGVRVMTVHGAKGLEAPVVILADAATKPRRQMVGKPVYIIADHPGPLLIHANGDAEHLEATLPLKQAVDANIFAEYWRRLYVGMTRAEDELYVTGALTPGSDAVKQLETSWYEAIEMALRPHAESITDVEGRETALVYPRQGGAPPPVGPARNASIPVLKPLTLSPVIPQISEPVLTPSGIGKPIASLRALDSLAAQARDADVARQDGIALHALLQHLSRIEPALWSRIASKALAVLLPEAEKRHGVLTEKAISILTRPELAALFGPQSRAEVPFLIPLLRDGAPVRLAGRMDRLVIAGTDVTVVDYKSDASVPASPDSVSQQYLTQLGLYALVTGQLFPDRSVQAAILWTQAESLMYLPHTMLAAGAKGFTAY